MSAASALATLGTDGVTVRFGGLAALEDLTLELSRDEILGLIGPNGAGKSTLINVLSGFQRVAAGRVHADDRDITGRLPHDISRLGIARTFQAVRLFAGLTVLENVAFPLKVGGMGRNARNDKVRPIIEMVGLKGREEAYPRELSGGQRQRVGIARSLAGDCSVWFLDEPFSALDPLIRRQLQDEFLEIRARLNTTIVFITHDIGEALKLADRIAIMRDGEIVQIGTPAEIVLNPVDGYVREFSRDVARGRHARVDSVMRMASSDMGGSSDPGLRLDMTLEAALAACMSLYEPVPVHGDSGEIIGMVHPADLVSALQVDES